MRTFIALELPDKIKRDLKEIQKDLIEAGVQAGWVKPEIAHLTLSFLGSITPNKIKLIGRLLEEAASQIKPAELYFLKIGCFPNLAKARIIFVDLGGELEKLNTLATKIRKRLKKERIFFDKKPFAAHITLGRIKKRQNLKETIKKVKIKKVKFTANEVTLIKSTLTSSGPIYTQLKWVFLK